MAKNLILLMLVAISVGCSPQNSFAPTQTSNQGNNVLSTASSIVSLATLEQNNSAFTQINISNQDKQGFNEDTNFELLIKIQENKIGSFNLSNKEIDFEQQLPGFVIDYPVMSEDGLLIAYIYSLQDQKYLGVKNLTAGNEEFSTPLPKEAVLSKWISKTKLAVWGGSAEWQCLHLLLILDSSTTNIIYPNYAIPDLQKSDCIQLPFVNTDGTKIIYPWKVFDFQDDISIDIFPFMKNFPRIPSAYALKGVNENISIAYAIEGELNYALNLHVVEINKEETRPKAVLLPGLATKGGWWQPLTWWGGGQMKLGMDLINKETNPTELLVSGQQPPTRFYVVDFDTHQIINYDLDRGVFNAGSLPQRIFDGFPSPDGKYYAWTIFDSLTGLPLGSKVLELSSGFVISISQLEILGWTVSTIK